MPLNNVIRVNARVTSAGAAPVNFGRALFLRPGVKATDLARFAKHGVDPVTYATLDAVAADYAISDDAHLAASKWFRQEPFPSQMLVGMRFAADIESRVYGGAPASVATIEAHGDDTAITFNGANYEVDLDATANIAAIGAAVQAALAGVSGIAVSVVNGRLLVETDPMDLGEGFQDSQVTRDLGLSAAAGAVVRNGTAAETVVEALTRLNRVNENWYFLCVSESYVDTADISAMADWAAANDKMLIIDTHQASARDPAAAVAAGIALALSEAGSENVAAVYSGHSDYKAVSLAARFSSVNFGGRDTLINGKFRTLPSVTPDDSLTEAEENVLKERRINFYKTLGNEPVVQDGQTFGGWIDVQFWLDWFTDKVRRDVYDLLRSTARVPQTTDGVAALKGVVENVCIQGVRNGGIAPGTLTETLASSVRQVTGVEDFDGSLTSGFLVHIGSLAEQTQVDREARRAPPVNVWLKGSGAINRVDIELTFEN